MDSIQRVWNSSGFQCFPTKAYAVVGGVILGALLVLAVVLPSMKGQDGQGKPIQVHAYEIMLPWAAFHVLHMAIALAILYALCNVGETWSEVLSWIIFLAGMAAMLMRGMALLMVAAAVDVAGHSSDKKK